MSLGLRAAGWMCGLILTVSGVVGMVAGASSWVEIPAAIAAAVGAIQLVAVIRCRRHEVTVGRRWLKIRLGPLKQDLARDLIGAATIRPARSWRRLYADREVVLELTTGGERSALPSGEPEELVKALDLYK